MSADIGASHRFLRPTVMLFALLKAYCYGAYLSRPSTLAPANPFSSNHYQSGYEGIALAMCVIPGKEK